MSFRQREDERVLLLHKGYLSMGEKYVWSADMEISRDQRCFRSRKIRFLNSL